MRNGLTEQDVLSHTLTIQSSLPPSFIPWLSTFSCVPPLPWSFSVVLTLVLHQVLCLNAYKLIGRRSTGLGTSNGSRLGRLIFADGLIFFFIASVFNSLELLFFD